MFDVYENTEKFVVNFYGRLGISGWHDLAIHAGKVANTVGNSQHLTLEKYRGAFQLKGAVEFAVDKNYIGRIRTFGEYSINMARDFPVRISDFFTRIDVVRSHQLVSWGARVVMSSGESQKEYGEYREKWPGLPKAVSIAYHSGSILVAAERYFQEMYNTAQQMRSTTVSPTMKSEWDRTLEEAGGNFVATVERMKSAGYIVPSSEIIFEVMNELFAGPNSKSDPEVYARHRKVIANIIDGTISSFGGPS